MIQVDKIIKSLKMISIVLDRSNNTRKLKLCENCSKLYNNKFALE
jgi:hypothetical protein